MTDLSRKVLDAITAKREAAAATILKAQQDEAAFKERFAPLIAALDELQASHIANASGEFSWRFERSTDDLKRTTAFKGISFRFGPDEHDQVRRRDQDQGRTYLEILNLDAGGNKYRLRGDANSTYLAAEYDIALRALGKRDTYGSGSGYFTNIDPGKKADVTEVIIGYLAAKADR